jgi:hypothetical protein
MCHACYPTFGSSTTPISFTLKYVRASRTINGLPSDLCWTQPFLIKFLPGKCVCSVSSNCYVYPTFLLHLGLILMGTTKALLVVCIFDPHLRPQSLNIQGDQEVSVHLMITAQTTSKNSLNSFNNLLR